MFLTKRPDGFLGGEKVLQMVVLGPPGAAQPGQARIGSAWLGLARLGSDRLSSAKLGYARLGPGPAQIRSRSARPGSARLGSVRPVSVRLYPAWFSSARPGSDRLGPARRQTVWGFFQTFFPPGSGNFELIGHSHMTVSILFWVLAGGLHPPLKASSSHVVGGPDSA